MLPSLHHQLKQYRIANERLAGNSIISNKVGRASAQIKTRRVTSDSIRSDTSIPQPFLKKTNSDIVSPMSTRRRLDHIVQLQLSSIYGLHSAKGDGTKMILDDPEMRKRRSFSLSKLNKVIRRNSSRNLNDTKSDTKFITWMDLTIPVPQKNINLESTKGNDSLNTHKINLTDFYDDLEDRNESASLRHSKKTENESNQSHVPTREILLSTLAFFPLGVLTGYLSVLGFFLIKYKRLLCCNEGCEVWWSKFLCLRPSAHETEGNTTQQVIFVK